MSRKCPTPDLPEQKHCKMWTLGMIKSDNHCPRIQSFSNFNVHTNYLGILFKMQILFQ